MSGRESLRGFYFQTQVMLLCFLEHCAIESDFSMVGEPATNIDTGNFVDIKLFINKNGNESKKIIQVKKTIDTSKAKEVINTLLQDHLASDDQIELWFADYVLENKMELLDAYEKLQEAIDIPDFAETKIRKQLGNKEIIICVDGSIIEDYSFDGSTLSLKEVKVLDGINKDLIENEIVRACSLKKQQVISSIKTSLSETLVYRRAKFLDNLGIEAQLREEIEKKDYDFFKKIIIRQISEAELELKIRGFIPDPFTTSQKEILQDILFSFFFRQSSRSQKIDISTVNTLIIKASKEFGYKYESPIINWSNISISGAFAPNLMPRGDFTMGGEQ